jgi:acyl-CoA synthetase (NDP forming)
VKAAVVLSSGFGEMGDKGKRIEELIARTSLETGLRVLGPNCMGVYNATYDFNGTYFWELPRIKGNISFISQSGAYGGICFHQVRERRIGLSTFISIGNATDINHADCIEYLGRDEATRVIALFIEGLLDGRRFLEVASRVSRVKPIVAFKAGRSQAGSRAALSHTGSVAGSFEVYRAALKQAGVILVEDTEEFFDVAMALSACSKRLPAGNRVAILTISGGPSVSASDLCEEVGLSVPVLDDRLRDLLKGLTPEFAATSNPVDMTPQIDPRNYRPCVDLVMGEKEIGGAIAINVGLDNEEFAMAFALASEKTGKPVLSFTIDTPRITQAFHKMGIPVYPTSERAVRAYNGLVRYSSVRERVSEWPGPLPEPRQRQAGPIPRTGKILDEFRSKRVFERYGIPVCREAIVSTPEEALDAAKTVGYPVAFKLFGEDAPHKSELGGVCLGLTTPLELAEAFKRFSTCFGPGHSFLVQEYVPGQVEVILGGKRDPVFGPTVMIGIGGVLTELFKDFSLRVCPFGPADAREMVEELRGYALFSGYRGRERIDPGLLVDALLKARDLMMENPDILELDINPLTVEPGRVTAVDGLILFSDAPGPGTGLREQI